MINRQQAELAAEVLEVELDGLTSKLLGERYKEQVRVHHPDAGGEHEDFIRLQHAKGVLVQWLDACATRSSSPSASGPTRSSSASCAQCGGRGYLKTTRGFQTLTRQCPCQLTQES